MKDWTIRGAGACVSEKTFCTECLKHGHHCEAVDGGTLCAFCEDGVECPITQRYKREQQANKFACGSGRDSDSSETGDAGSPEHSTPKPHAIPKIPGPTNQPGEATTMEHNEERWCSKCKKIKIRANSKSGLCTPCQCGFAADNPKRLAAEAKSAGSAPAESTPKPKKKATWKKSVAKLKKVKAKTAPKEPPTPAEDPEPETAAGSLVFSEQQLVHMFTTLPLDDKLNCLQAYLNGVRA